MTEIVTRDLQRLLSVLLDTLQQLTAPSLMCNANDIVSGTVAMGTTLDCDTQMVLKDGCVRALAILSLETDDLPEELLISRNDFTDMAGGLGAKGWYTCAERDSVFLQIKGHMPNEGTMRSFEVEYFFHPSDVIGPLELK